MNLVCLLVFDFGGLFTYYFCSFSALPASGPPPLAEAEDGVDYDFKEADFAAPFPEELEAADQADREALPPLPPRLSVVESATPSDEVLISSHAFSTEEMAALAKYMKCRDNVTNIRFHATKMGSEPCIAFAKGLASNKCVMFSCFHEGQ